MHTTTLLLSTLLPLLSSAKDIPITVGNGALKFVPESVTAAVGDTLSFTYFPNAHSVTQSSFQDPCVPLAGGINSGFNPITPPGPNPRKFVVTVRDTKPIWFYCAQTNGMHCQKGMSMVVNVAPPPSPATLDAYKAKAASLKTNSTIPAGISGGVFVPINSTSVPSGTGTPSGTARPTGTGSRTSGTGRPSGTGAPGRSTSMVSFTGAAANAKVISSGLAVAGAAAWALSLF